MNTEPVNPTEIGYPEVEIWTKCFDSSWDGELDPKGFEHPAKFNRGIIERVVKRLIADKELVRRESVVFDPFGGVGCGGIVCAGHAIKWHGMEIEKRFVEFGHKNFKHKRWNSDIYPLPTLTLGDSRGLVPLIEHADAVLAGPASLAAIDDGVKEGSGAHGEKERRGRKKATSQAGFGSAVGQTAPNEMDFDAEYDLRLFRGKSATAVVSSPAYNDTGLGLGCQLESRAERMRRRGYTEPKIAHILSNAMKTDYGTADGQLGTGQATDQEFWEGSAQIVLGCHHLLRPGGMAVWMTRDYVRQKQRVDFSKKWSNLCISCGFEPVRWCRAMLVKTWAEETMDGVVIKKSDVKSFFRRFAEKRGSPPIDWEDVIMMRRPV